MITDVVKLSRTDYSIQQIFHGLKLLFQLDQSPSYEDRRNLLNTALKNRREARVTLEDELTESTGSDDVPAIWANGYIPPQIPGRTRAPETDDLNDPDSGPSHTFYNWPRRGTKNDFVMYWSRSSLRMVGYVLWDSDRTATLQVIGVLSYASQNCEMGIDFIAWGDPDNELGPDYEDEWAKMKSSFVSRLEIWRKGGRGYWDENDSSKVSWGGRWGGDCAV